MIVFSRVAVMTMTDPYDYLFKFLVIGSAGTGKSCLLHQVALFLISHTS